MNETQATAAVDYLESGATLVETASLVGLSWRSFSAEWIRGKHDAEADRETDAATFYREASASRARCRATIRAEARDLAETDPRAASAKLAVLNALENEVEPIEVEGARDNRIPVERYSEATQRLLHEAFCMMVEEDMERRERATA